MLIDADKILAAQLALTEPAEFAAADGRRTPLRPVREVPRLAAAAATVSLDGEWQVLKWPFPKPEAKLVAPGAAAARWAPVAQPGKVFYQDANTDVSTVKDWNRVGLTHLDPDDGAILRRTVRIPRAWKGRRVYLRFDAIYPAGRVYLDGVLLGEHCSGLTPVEWDVTERVVPGRDAVVAVRLLRRHKFVKMDMPRHACEFAGLAQSACFHATGAVQVSGHQLIPALDEALSAGTLSGTVQLANHSPRIATVALRLALAAPGGRRAASASVRLKLGPGESRAVPVTLRVRSPQLWNDEYPNLYALTLTLEVPGQENQELFWRIGFRLFDLSGGRPRLNGNPVKFRGVNHLTYHPEFGLHTPREWLVRNLSLMKKANVNTIRTHYLGPRALADVCDELGLYLLQELPIDWGTNYIHDPEWVGPALQRIMGGVVRDRDHASVMAWCVGNENMPESPEVADDGWHHLRLYDRLVKTLDPSRPTLFPPPGPANKIRGIFEVRVGDIGDTHYSFNLAKDFLKTGSVTNPRDWKANMETVSREEAMVRGWSGVWFSSEYGIMNLMPDLLNAPYSSIIDDVPEPFLSGRSTLEVFTDRLRREWGFMRREPSCLGGAYFPWLCSGTGDNPWGWVVWGEDNDWGVVTADLLPKPAFWAMRVLFSPVWFPARAVVKPGQASIAFDVENQFNAIDLSQCTLRVRTGGGPWVSSGRWREVPLRCPPGGRATVELPIWNAGTRETLDRGTACVLRCCLLDPKGFRVLTHDIVLVPESLARKEDERLAIGPDAVEA
jgi:beta-galactosidase